MQLVISKNDIHSDILLSIAFHLGIALAVTQVTAMGSPEKTSSAPVEIVQMVAPKGDTLRTVRKAWKKPAPGISIAQASPAGSAPHTVSADASSEAGSGEAGTRIGVANGQELEAADRYAFELRLMLDGRKGYPAVARKLRQQGRVVVRFKLQNDGKVLEARVLEKSPYESLNLAAESLIRGIDGLKPFPREIQVTTWEFTVPIEYRL